ncbi:MAG: hypothetical protein ACT4OZ_13695 [Gemmatimonadota bacterium]
MSHYPPHPSHRRKLLPALAALLIGCSVDSAGPTLHPRATDPTPSLTAGDPILVFKSKSDRRLLAWLEREKLRIDLNLKASERKYDSLKVVWEQMVRENNTVSEVLYCDPIQYVATTKIVGPSGENLDFGPHKLQIPRGALTGYTVVTAEGPVALKVEAKFAPHGLRFSLPSSLELSYKHCVRPTGFGKRIVYVDDAGTILESVVSNDKEDSKTVVGWIKHFSSYLIAY